MEIEYDEQALEEFTETLDYYERISPATRRKVQKSIQDVINALPEIVEKKPRVLGQPVIGTSNAYNVKVGKHRLVVVQVFEKQGKIRITSITSTHRRPGHWRDRLK